MRAHRTVGAKLQIRPRFVLPRFAWLMSILLTASSGSASFAGELSVAPASMARIGTVDERYQSYNIEMVEVTGGEFWKPYGSEPAPSPPNTAASDNSKLFQYRPPIVARLGSFMNSAAAMLPPSIRVKSRRRRA